MSSHLLDIHLVIKQFQFLQDAYERSFLFQRRPYLLAYDYGPQGSINIDFKRA